MSKIKRILSITLVFVMLFSGGTFSAIVSDNDPDAFITRAEFEAMVSSIDEELSNYYSTIDNFIDSAITTYISGFAGESIDNGNNIKY